MAFAYIWVGIQHFVNAPFFLNIMPPYLPFHLELVYLSGLFEIVLGAMLLVKSLRFYAGWGLILLLIAVYPANIYLAFNETPQQLLDVSPFVAAWVRLPIQFVLIGLAYWHSKG